MTAPALGVLEEFVAFLIDRKARRIHVDNWILKCGVGGAVLLDLVLAKRIVIETRGSGLVSVADATPTSIEFLDDILSEIAETPDERGAQHWVSACANRADNLIAVALERLTADGVVSIDGDGNYSIADDVLDTGQYSGVLSPPHSRQSSWVRLPRIVCGEHEPTTHDIALICLAHTCGELQRQFTPEQMELARPRLVAIEQQDSSCKAITQAVRSCFRDIVVRKAAPQRIPKLKIKDFLSPTMRRGDLGKWFAELSGKYGPVFELPQPGNRQVVLASAEANYWTEQNGWKYLRAKDYVTGYEEVYGCPGSILSTDGPEHSHLRQLVLKRGPLAVLEDRVDDIFRLCRHYYKRWISGRAHSARSEMLMLMSKIVAEIGLGVHADHVIRGLKEYEVRAVKTQIMRILPRRMMHTRKMRRIREQLDDLVDKIIHSHENARQFDPPRNLSDEILLQHRGDPHALPVEHLSYAFLSVLVAGQNLGNLLSFALYELINNPHLLEGIRAEADAIFEAPPPPAETFSTTSVDLTERFFMEVCRLHPVGAGSLRTVKNRFEICGRRIELGTPLLIAFVAPHYFEEHYRDVDRFDPDRFGPDRAEHLQPGVYAPFGCDGHRCPMHRWTRLLMTINLLLIAHHLNFEASPENYQLRKQAYPTMSPDKAFKFRVTSVRKPLDGEQPAPLA